MEYLQFIGPDLLIFKSLIHWGQNRSRLTLSHVEGFFFLWVCKIVWCSKRSNIKRCSVWSNIKLHRLWVFFFQGAPYGAPYNLTHTEYFSMILYIFLEFFSFKAIKNLLRHLWASGTKAEMDFIFYFASEWRFCKDSVNSHPKKVWFQIFSMVFQNRARKIPPFLSFFFLDPHFWSELPCFRKKIWT